MYLKLFLNTERASSFHDKGKLFELPFSGIFEIFRIDNVRLKKYSFSGGTKGVIIYTKGRTCRIDSASRLHGS